jgi:hypothetical protein
MAGSGGLKQEDATLSLYQLLDPECLATPYPLYTPHE